MAARFLSELSTPSVVQARKRSYGRPGPAPAPGEADALGEDERAFIADRDSFYLATVSESGWPYLQHRGGKPGFLRVLGEHRIAFADVRGNRQLLSTGNVAANDRVALLLMDYPNRQRLKLIGHARTLLPTEAPELLAELAPDPAMARTVERLFVIEVVGVDWNCPAGITPRYTEDEVRAWAAPLRSRVAELEAELAAARRTVAELRRAATASPPR